MHVLPLAAKGGQSTYRSFRSHRATEHGSSCSRGACCRSVTETLEPDNATVRRHRLIVCRVGRTWGSRPPCAN